MIEIREGPSKADGTPTDIVIATTNPMGKGVNRYKKLLSERILARCGSDRAPEDEYNIVIDRYDAKEIIRAAIYGGLDHQDGLHEEEFIKKNGENSEYTLIINKALSEMVLFVDGDTYPLRNNKELGRKKANINSPERI